MMPDTTLADASGSKIDGCANVTFCAAFSVGALRTTNSKVYVWPTDKSLYMVRVSSPKDRDHPAAVTKPPLETVPLILLLDVVIPSISLPDVALPLIPEITMVASQNIRIGATAGVSWMEMVLSEHGFVELDCMPTLHDACRISKTVPFIAIVFSDEILGTLIDTVVAFCALLPLRLQHGKTN